VNWSRGEDRAKLQAALFLWKNGGHLMVNETNGKPLSMTAFAKIEGIPVMTFHKYARGKQAIGDFAGSRKKSSEHLKTPEAEVATKFETTADRRGDANSKRKKRLKAKLVGVPNLNRTVTVRRKAAKRSEPWFQNTAIPLSIPLPRKKLYALRSLLPQQQTRLLIALLHQTLR
jgi:hypothetical protein